MSARILIINGNPGASTERIVSLGGEPYGENYSEALRLFEPKLTITVLNAADGDRLPNSVALEDFDGIAWTGSSLSAYWEESAVRDQIELARAVWRSGVPSFGSCWGQQIMCQALGGEVRANPKGIEIGVARRISLTPAGAMHPMYAGKGPAFDALAIHKDEVISLPGGATVLASNAMSDIQAVFLSGEGDFWGVQYHPEFDLHMIATLLQRDTAALVKQGLFAKEADVAGVVADFEALHKDPKRSDLAWRYGIDADVLDPKRRMAEFGSWLRRKALPRAAAR
ncbi:MAG: type 1 glutamine amidotransferase [Pseudomonadota bacterium]|nr:type 1 glutamine amidotransferase [Pseudomonadota bacterium]